MDRGSLPLPTNPTSVLGLTRFLPLWPSPQKTLAPPLVQFHELGEINFAKNLYKLLQKFCQEKRLKTVLYDRRAVRYCSWTHTACRSAG